MSAKREKRNRVVIQFGNESFKQLEAKNKPLTVKYTYVFNDQCTSMLTIIWNRFSFLKIWSWLLSVKAFVLTESHRAQVDKLIRCSAIEFEGCVFKPSHQHNYMIFQFYSLLVWVFQSNLWDLMELQGVQLDLYSINIRQNCQLAKACKINIYIVKV